MVEGRKAVSEVFHSNLHVVTILATATFVSKENPAYPCEVISQAEMARLSAFTTPPGVIAVVNMPETDLGSVDFKQPLMIALDGISDPGNLGTIARTADWYGVSELLLSENCADFYNSKCLAATMGSFIRIKVHYCDLQKVLSGKRVYGCYLQGESVHDMTFSYPAILLIGSESHGISTALDNVVTNRITIPSFGSAESLNAGIAAGIVMDRMVAAYQPEGDKN